MKKVIALSALLASTTAYAALAQDATTTPDATTPPAATTETTPPATGMDATGTDTMAPAAGDTAPAATDGATGTGMTGTDTGMAEGMQIPEGYTAYAGEPMTAEDLQDADVYSMNDESVSDISDFVLAEDGKVEQVIFDVGGFLGIGARNVAVPFEDLKIYTNEDQSDVRVYVPMSREELEALPEYTAAE
ncbi:PRC-barrel domain containing protein [Rhodobacter sphaeroides]|jgi:PRC-barrel domain.|uniref:PRC-barrel domain-containing protein n=1 Tax=Cereibacter sphaeroides (strain ATCC 17023 / DSM 158 / JCM 6121 / CCUG 31486 / LMG 2827 / NBRC 12203 / NCIMB 8253 / ATH 2.4.1.) TaxID=272943 RepID=Q3J306_CERS4|nr:PRC-barrel domain-containing protein [Cereibacter sphaeroides]ABN76441.1 PRC-barrel domain protein [Cereibacter sphaeroides ATCC 17029]ABA78828.2 PRC-barrel domain-containing protein [Cereibacter sphaeroides 2.4.1]AMJ47164.1 photosystem reaction center subunit H [Cereibacter sphaeroides]ANS33876.1 photosystem reaction center subunit H [Cereibacter sphaeroides]ATN62920.1 photosystem reaction center subunit H [Cereibacter sphaeroides]